MNFYGTDDQLHGRVRRNRVILNRLPGMLEILPGDSRSIIESSFVCVGIYYNLGLSGQMLGNRRVIVGYEIKTGSSS